MCLSDILNTEVKSMNKKILVIFLIIVFVAILGVSSQNIFSQDFDGSFSMNVPLGQHYSDVAYCRENGALGCAREYWADSNDDCTIDENDIVVYYYDNSLLVDGEANAYDHALGALTTSYLYNLQDKDGRLMILTNDISMKNLPPFLVGVNNGDGSEVVFVGGYHLDELKDYANSIEFK